MSEEKKPRESKAAPRGAWVVLDESGHVVIVESSEIKAFRAAAPTRGRVAFWRFGASLEEVSV